MGQNLQQKFTAPQNEVRLAIMNFIVDHQRPFHVRNDGFGALQHVSLSQAADFPAIVDALRAEDGMVLDPSGNVNFIYPVSALPTPHKVTLQDGRSFTAMCAIDAMGAAFTFQQDVEINSACAECGKPVRVRLHNGQLQDATPEGLHILTFRLEDIVNWAGSC